MYEKYQKLDNKYIDIAIQDFVKDADKKAEKEKRP